MVFPVHNLTPCEQDMAKRLRISVQVQKVAVAMCAAAGARSNSDVFVFVGLALPGKTQGIWEIGQKVEQAPGYFLATSVAEARIARDLADQAAGVHLAGRVGTSCYVRIRPDGTSAVFEGIYNNEAPE